MGGIVADERDYVLGTHDAELSRLGLQHAVWRPRALAAWQRAGFTAGQRLLDIGCGPGYASFDLADIVGPAGAVVALDRSARFLEAGRERAAARRQDWIDFRALDLDQRELGVSHADGAWVRWVFAFLRRPRSLLERLHGALRPGARLVVHEYFDYGTWRLVPRSAAFEEFVATVMESWRAAGGEPDVALSLLGWLPQVGFRIEVAEPVVYAVAPRDFVWRWPATFVETGVERLVETGRLTPPASSAILDALAATAADPHGMMITPGVLEIVASRE
jgi:ubiquinone/menaquinone biosynthesis C-methylase UbiE